MKKHIKLAAFIASNYRLLLTVTALFFGFIGDGPPGS